MGLTTFETMRDTQRDLIHALAPTSLDGTRFRINLAERDFEGWAEAHPTACLRRFAIADLYDYEPVDVSDLVQEYIRGIEAITVAYPDTFIYGPDNRRDKRDVIRADMHAIDGLVGHRGYANYTDGLTFIVGQDLVPLEGVTLLVMTFQFEFYRSVAA